MPLDSLTSRAPSRPSWPGIGENRKQAGWRLLYGVVYWVVMFAGGIVFAVFYLLWMAVDIIYQLLTNRDGLGSDSIGGELFDKQTKLREFIVFGEGSRNDWRR